MWTRPAAASGGGGMQAELLNALKTGNQRGSLRQVNSAVAAEIAQLREENGTSAEIVTEGRK